MSKPVRILILGIFTLACFLFLPPWQPRMPAAGLDPSWGLVLVEAFQQGLQWGKDIVFSYGPAGFIGITHFHPELYIPTLVLWVLITACFCGSTALISANSTVTATALLAAIVFFSLTLTGSRDALFLNLPILMFFLHRLPPTGTTGGLMLALVSICALAAHMKLTYGVLALVAVLAIDLERTIRRKLPCYAAAFVVMFFLTFVLLGQDLGNLPAHLRYSLEVAGGYGSAMQTPSPPGGLELGAFAVVVASLLALVCAALFDKTGDGWLNRLLGAGLFLAFFLLVAKAGFVRHDRGHSILVAWPSLSVFCGLLLSQDWLYRRGPRTLRALVTGLMVVPLIGLWAMIGRHQNVGPSVADWSHLLAQKTSQLYTPRALERKLTALAGAFQPHKRLEYAQTRESRLDRIAADHQIPARAGTADTIKSMQSAVIGSELSYRPRPVFQGYAAYTPALAELNQRFFSGERAPDYVLFGVEAIDKRLPSITESLSWLALLQHYRPAENTRRFLLLERAANPARVELQPGEPAEARFGDAVALPELAEHALWIEIDIDRTWKGRLLGLLWKEPVVQIELTDSAGETQAYRLPRRMAETGFVISPHIDSHRQFALLYATHRPTADYFVGIRQFRVLIPESGAGAFQPRFRYRLARVAVAAAAPAADAGGSQDDLLLEDLLRTSTLSQARVKLRADGTLFAHSPATLWLPKPNGQVVNVGFGMDDRAWQSGDSPGVVFSVAAELEDGTTIVLWARALHPVQNEGDRGEQRASFSLLGPSVKIRRLIFSTSPAVADLNRWGWSYWSHVSIQ